MIKIIKDYGIVLLGTFIMAVAVKVFILPFNVLSGGVAGIAVALEPIFHLDPDFVINVLVLSMFILGTIVLGKDFAMKTFLSSIVYPVYLPLIDPFVPVLDLDPMIASIYGGIVAGIGIGMVIRTGSSTGGMDILALLGEKYFKIPSHIGCLILDGATVILGVAMYSIHDAMIGLLSVFVTSVLIDKTVSFGGQKTKALIVISDKYEEILSKIKTDMDRGATLLHGEGGYSRDGKEVIFCVIENNQYPEFTTMINAIDPNAFIVVQDAHEVKGDGFTYYSETRLKTMKKRRSIYEK